MLKKLSRILRAGMVLSFAFSWFFICYLLITNLDKIDELIINIEKQSVLALSAAKGVSENIEIPVAMPTSENDLKIISTSTRAIMITLSVIFGFMAFLYAAVNLMKSSLDKKYDEAIEQFKGEAEKAVKKLEKKHTEEIESSIHAAEAIAARRFGAIFLNQGFYLYISYLKILRFNEFRSLINTKNKEDETLNWPTAISQLELAKVLSEMALNILYDLDERQISVLDKYPHEGNKIPGDPGKIRFLKCNAACNLAYYLSELSMSNSGSINGNEIINLVGGAEPELDRLKRINYFGWYHLKEACLHAKYVVLKEEVLSSDSLRSDFLEELNEMYKYPHAINDRGWISSMRTKWENLLSDSQAVDDL